MTRRARKPPLRLLFTVFVPSAIVNFAFGLAGIRQHDPLVAVIFWLLAAQFIGFGVWLLLRRRRLSSPTTLETPRHTAP